MTSDACDKLTTEINAEFINTKQCNAFINVGNSLSLVKCGFQLLFFRVGKHNFIAHENFISKPPSAREVKSSYRMEKGKFQSLGTFDIDPDPQGERKNDELSSYIRSR